MQSFTMVNWRTVVSCLFVISLLLTNVADGSRPACELWESENIESGRTLNNGDVVHDGIKYPRKYQFWYIPPMYPSPEIENNTSSLPIMDGDHLINTTLAFIPDYPHTRGCACKLRICVRKCCPPGQVVMDRMCVDGYYPPDFRPNIWFHRNGNLKSMEWDPQKYVFVKGNTCLNGSKFELDPTYHEDEHYLYINGSLHMPYYYNGNLKYFDHKSYCMDYKLVENGSRFVRETHLCLQLGAQEPSRDVLFDIFPIGLILSIIFLILTFLVYLILPELHTLHGKALMHYVGALAIAYSFLAAIQITTREMSNEECISYGMICYISFLLSFFWLNIMSFDIWWAFSGKAGFRGGVREAERKKFLCYLCYAWIGTLTIFSITTAMQFHPEVPLHHSPGFGYRKCWLQDSALFLYFYLPFLILIVANIVLFGLTAFKIITIRRETQVLRQEGSTKHTNNPKVADDTQRFWLYIKLFIVMGVNWSMEILSWALGGSKWLWIISDVFNSIQGLMIFLIFVFKPKIKKLLIKRLLPKHPSKVLNPILMACCPTEKAITTDATSVGA